MAKKTTKKKTTKKKPVAKTAKTPSKKVTKKKPVSKKTVTKKAPVKKTTKKPVSKKTVTKKTVKKAPTKTTKKTTTKKTPVKKTTKTTTKKTPVKKTPTTKKAPAKKPSPAASKTSAKTAPKPATPKVDPKAPATKAGEPEKPKRINRRRSSKPKAPLVLPDRPLLGSIKNLKPLIASGSSVRKSKSVLDGDIPKKIKSPYNKRQLDGFKAILLAKRAELLGDITHLEDEALKNGGDSGHTSNHISEQGSDNYDQALNLNLAAADRNLIIEIDEALVRIADRTYGACMITGEPIKEARLEELPWAKHSIKAAQELDQRGY